MPQYPRERGEGHRYVITTFWEKLVSEYTGLDLPSVNQLDYFEYLAIRRDAWIYRLNQTEEGRKYLDDAYRMTLTEPDRGKLREQFSKR